MIGIRLESWNLCYRVPGTEMGAVATHSNIYSLVLCVKQRVAIAFNFGKANETSAMKNNQDDVLNHAGPNSHYKTSIS